MGIEWRDSLSIGVAEIDNQHKQLILHFDKLLKACEAGQGMDELKKLLGFLDEYVVKHFRDEEAIQRLRNYPDYADHKKEHESFIAKLNAVKQEINKEGMALHHLMETNNMILKWLVHHISEIDGKLGRYLNELKA
jgi:hemerythrin